MFVSDGVDHDYIQSVQKSSIVTQPEKIIKDKILNAAKIDSKQCHSEINPDIKQELTCIINDGSVEDLAIFCTNIISSLALNVCETENVKM